MSTTKTGTSSPSLADDFAATLAAAAEVQMGDWEKADAAKPGAPAGSKPSEDKSEAEAPAPGSDAAEAEAANPPGEAKPDSAPDLSWAPENIREKLSTLDPDVAEWVKGNVLRQSDYTKKTQKAAELAKQAEAVKARAELWDALQANPDLSAFALSVLRGEAELPGARGKDPEDDVDLTSADNATIKRYIDGRVESRAKEIAEAKIRERVVAPNQERQAAIQALASYAEEHGVDLTAMDDAVRAAEAHWATVPGVKWTAENVVGYVAPFVPKGTPAATKQPAPTPSPGGLSKVASPASRPVAKAPPPVPAHRREKREPRTPEERVAEAAALLRDKGFDLTPDDINELFKNGS